MLINQFTEGEECGKMARQRLYSSLAIERLLQYAMDNDYEILQIAEGSLGYGHMILLSHHENWDNVEICEKFLTAWSSGHRVRKFQKISKRQQLLIDEAHERGEGVNV